MNTIEAIEGNASVISVQKNQKASTGSLNISPYFHRKAASRKLVGCVLLVAFSPVMLAAVILVRITSRGPGLYSQVRVGKDGAPFKLYKIRTMYRDAEKATGPTWAKPGDSRITPVGRVLRFLHLDELPQLINVARGEMDLVGPRPERPEIIERDRLTQEVPRYAERHRVLPGVTGLAQINLPPDQTIRCVCRKVALDLEYVNSACRWLDVRLLLCTALRMLGVRHSRAVSWLALDRPSVWVLYPSETSPTVAANSLGVQKARTSLTSLARFPFSKPARLGTDALVEVGVGHVECYGQRTSELSPIIKRHPR